jgi:hypothetical protein
VDKADLAARDAAVLEAVLLDVFTDPKSPLEGPREKGAPIRFTTTRLKRAPDPEIVLRRYDTKAWDRLSAAQLEQIKQAAGNLQRRVAAKDSLVGFRPKDARIAVLVPVQDEPRQRLPLGPQVFDAYPPGYTADGQLAVVHLGFPWSIHHGDATYILTRRGGGWSILLKQFVLYP